MSPKIYDLAKIVNKERLKIGAYSQIDDFVFINAGEETVIGMFVHIASFTSVIGGGRFYMEDFSGLSAGCRIITGSDDFSGGALTNPTVPKKYTNVNRSEIRIGRHAILGTNVTVFPGVTIPEGVAVGAGAIVRKNLEPWTIYAGMDCRAVKKREKEKIQELEQELLREIGLENT
jgi:galactoside O-acetyltransferase